MSGIAGFRSFDRLLLTLILAIILHAVFILGISFNPAPKPVTTPTVQVLLRQQTPIPEPTVEPAEPAEPAGQPSLPEKPQNSNPMRPLKAPAQPQQAITPTVKPAKEPTTNIKKIVRPPSATLPQPVTKASRETNLNKAKEHPPISADALLARSLNIARLTPLDDLSGSLPSERVRRLTSSSVNTRYEDNYLSHWRQKVQQVGHLNYPEDARRQKLSGSLRLLVILRPDGTLETVEVLTSSGRVALDQAAVKIVHLASPFQPFPVEMRKTTDRLEIIRVWKFENNSVLY